ncbi:hypothetical protein [Streptomyces nanshensis]|uniref:hypothetical protein n=1 Tax=Streptomyces nanshensis TaxID=518642 RepID=UPI00149573CC|nr:hypothetical protein [Streptomyces nanshensis]
MGVPSLLADLSAAGRHRLHTPERTGVLAGISVVTLNVLMTAGTAAALININAAPPPTLSSVPVPEAAVAEDATPVEPPDSQ